MKISIVIPTYNQAAYLGETLRSVLDQGYPDVEIIVCDGGSPDHTKQVLEEYSDRLAWWCSEKDRGQTDAINKGLGHITGEIWSYLNSDDLLAPGSLARIAEEFRDPEVQWLGGVSTMFDQNGERGRIEPVPAARRRDYLTPWNRSAKYLFPCSNVNFMRRSVLDQLGTFDDSLHFGMDIEYYVRAIFAEIPLTLVPDVLGHWRWHEESKTMTDGVAYRFLEDEIKIAERYVAKLPLDQRREVEHELSDMHRHLAVRRALHQRDKPADSKVLDRLVAELKAQPTLLFFRPWLGAIRRQLFARA